MEKDRPRRRPIQAKSIDGISVNNLPKKIHLDNNLKLRNNQFSQDSVKPNNIKTMPSRPKSTPLKNQKSTSSDDSILNKSIPAKLNNRTRRKKRSKKKIIFSTIGILLVLIIAAVGWDAWQLYHKLHHVEVHNLTASVGGAENILVAGSTNRCNLKVQNAQWGFCSEGVTGVNSDIIFIVHLVPKTHTISLLSIPRDTFVPNARSGAQAYKIDAALYQGPSQLVNAVQEDFGIPIQHYAEVGFDGFVNIVNAIGGIKMDFPMPVYDSESYLNIQTAGCKTLNGVEALQVVRARHLQYKAPGITTNDTYYWPQENESDIARIVRTHEFIRVLASTVSAKGIKDPVTDQKLVDAIAPQIQVDSGLSTSEMISLLQEFHGVNVNKVPQYTLPIVTTNFGDYVYNDNDYGDVVFPIEANDQQTINQFLGVSNSINSMTGKTLPKPSTINVNVVNGSGTADQASQVTTGLQSLGFNMVGQPTDSTPLSEEANETVVYYSGPKTEADAITVARQLSGYVILAQDANMVTNGSEVTVLTGTDATVNSPSSSSISKTATSTANSPTTNSSTSASTSSIGVVSPNNQGLSAWDPRACTE